LFFIIYEKKNCNDESDGNIEAKNREKKMNLYYFI